MLYKSKKYVLICGTLLCTSNLLLGSSKGDSFGFPPRCSRTRVFGTSGTPQTPQIPRRAFENQSMFESDFELTCDFEFSRSPDGSPHRPLGSPSGRRGRSPKSTETSYDYQSVCSETLEVRREWIERLDVFGNVYECVEKIDSVFPHLGFRLAFAIGWVPKANPIFGAKLPGFIPDGDSAGNVQGLKIANAGFGTYILKPKDSMGRFRRGDPKCVERESLAGEEIRAAFVQEILEIEAWTPGMTFNEILMQIRRDYQFLEFLVAPVDCGDYIASREVPEATSVWGALQSSFPSINLGGSNALGGGGMPIPGIPMPNLWSMDQENVISTMNFGYPEQRITMARNLWAIMQFLHRHGINHGDLRSGNFLASSDDYTQIYLIDFDQANNPRRPNDENKMREFLIEYLSCTTKACRFTEGEEGIPFENVRTAINELNELNPSFQYTPEQLAEIERILTQSFPYTPETLTEEEES